MLEALVITLREGVEAALIVGITLAYLNKTGRIGMRRTVYAGLIAAFVASIAVAFGISKTSFNPDLFEGWIMLVAAFFVVTMVWFMAKAAKSMKGDIERKVGGLAENGSRVGLFLFIFLMVLREGVETVLILSAVSLTTTELLSFIGTLLGVFLSILFGVMFVRGSVRINLGKFFKVTTVILIFVALQLLISGLHELSETGVIPSSKRQMAIIGPIVRNDIFFFVTMLALTALMVLFESKRRAPEASAVTESPAEQRKKAWSARKEKFWTTSVYVSSFVFIMLVTAQFIYAKSSTSLSEAIPVTFNAGKVSVTVDGMQPGDMRRYSATMNGKPVRFLIYKKPNGKLVTVMDACEICGGIGYYNGAQGLTCKNCNAPVNGQTVGEGGGCNPIPLTSSIDGSTVTVSEADVAQSAGKIKE